MIQPPKLSDVPKYPIVAGVAILSIAATIAWWARFDVSPLFENALIRRGQLWRLFTSIFLHADIFHLAFNLYWLWIFGTSVERVFGHARTALLIALLALGSGSVQFALDSGGVGLSGVGYGLFGLLWVLSSRDERFRDALNPRTIGLFVVWFFLCVFTTVTGAYVVGNFAHGAGAVIGILIGCAIAFPAKRLAAEAAIAAIVLLGVWGSTFGLGTVNLTGKIAYEEGKTGYDALLANRNEEAIRWFRGATKHQPKTPEFWFDLGIAYHRQGNIPAAMAAYQRAHDLDPNNVTYSKALEPAE
jgi:membrane associated rhomboid family serine protease